MKGTAFNLEVANQAHVNISFFRVQTYRHHKYSLVKAICTFSHYLNLETIKHSVMDLNLSDDSKATVWSLEYEIHLLTKSQVNTKSDRQPLYLIVTSTRPCFFI